MAKEQRQLSNEEIVNLVNQLQSQVKTQGLVIKDLGDKVAAKEMENSNLRAVLTQIQSSQVKADDAPMEEE
jgi:anaerobic glycerol-3-phosphate dehydrogenase